MATVSTANKTARIAVAGAGWWTQGWHLPHLKANYPRAEITAIVDPAAQPKSNLNPYLEPLSTLREKYKCPTFSSFEEMFAKDPELSASLDGALICTPHATHSDIGSFLLEQAMKRKNQSTGKPLHILMEKPMTTNVEQAKKLHDTVQECSTGSFMINHSANYIPQTQVARELVKSGRIGEIRHITGFFASPLSWIFEDPSNKGWNEPTPGLMLGNGFAWGQQSHLLSWIYHVSGPSLVPQRVFCAMGYSQQTGADVSHAATIQCNNGATTFSLSGTSLLPGNAHSDPPVAKQIKIKIYGTKGALLYMGEDQNKNSGRLELRIGGNDAGAREGVVEVHCEELGFCFEELDQDGTGPQSLQSFISACIGENDYYVGADSLVGLRSVQTLDAMYRSDASGHAEDVAYQDV